MLNAMCLDCQKLCKLGGDCKGTENPVWSGCIYKKKVDDSMVNKIKEDTRKRLKELGYSERQMDFIHDIVSVVRPGVVLMKEKLNGEYTGRLTELYL